MNNYKAGAIAQADRPLVLSIAGFDPCGGAGILADIKTFEQLKTKGMGLITANTLQTEHLFHELQWQVTADLCRHIEVLMRSYPIPVIKIGIVKDADMLQQIISTIRQQNENTFIIWDPVLKSSTGFTFFAEKGSETLKDILKQIDLLTPNLPELEQLQPFISAERTVLLKGGHRQEQQGLDILFHQGQEIALAPATQTAYAKHGSGCVLSAAIAAYIASGTTVEEACSQGKIYVERFLNSHPSLLGYHYAE